MLFACLTQRAVSHCASVSVCDTTKPGRDRKKKSTLSLKLWGITRRMQLWNTLYSIESVEPWSPRLVWIWHSQPWHLAEVLLKGLLRPRKAGKHQKARQQIKENEFLLSWQTEAKIYITANLTCQRWQTQSQTFAPTLWWFDRILPRPGSSCGMVDTIRDKRGEMTKCDMLLQQLSLLGYSPTLSHCLSPNTFPQTAKSPLFCIQLL